MTLTWRDLFVETVRAPDQAATTVMALPLSRRDIWLAVIAVAALNAVFGGLIDLIAPTPPEAAEAFPMLVVSPLAQALIIGGLLVLLAHVLTWVGRVMGGQGSIDDMMKLMVWMQFVAMALQAANLVILLALPPLGSLLVLVIVIVMLRVLLGFIKTGHGFETMGNAALVLFASFIGMILGLSFLLVLIGAGQLGVIPSV